MPWANKESVNSFHGACLHGRCLPQSVSQSWRLLQKPSAKDSSAFVTTSGKSELTSYGLSCLKMHIKFFHKIRVRTAFRDCRAPTWKSRTSHAPIRPQKKWEHTSMKLSAGLPRNCHYTPLERKKRVDFCQWQAASLKLGSVKWMACHFLPKSSAASFSIFLAISMKNCVIGDCFFIHPMNLK